MKQTILFKDLGSNRSYKEIWDLQESMLQENLRLKSVAGSRQSAVSSEQPAVSSEPSVVSSQQPLNSEYTHNSQLTTHNASVVSSEGFVVSSEPVASNKHSVNNQLTTGNSQLTTHNSHLSSVIIHPSTQNHLLFVEHKPVYTLGKSGDIGHVLIGEKEREQKGIEFFKINRGGDITFHGPEQLVGYPILDLEYFKTDLGWYLRSLEEVIMLTIAEYGIKGNRSKGETGVWVDPDIKGRERKICAIGIRCSRWITMHGFAFNVNTNLEYFNYIIPCGIENKQVTSLEKEVGYKIPMAEVKQKVRNNFGTVFNVELVEAASREP